MWIVGSVYERRRGWGRGWKTVWMRGRMGGLPDKYLDYTMKKVLC